MEIGKVFFNSFLALQGKSVAGRVKFVRPARRKLKAAVKRIVSENKEVLKALRDR